MSDRPPVSTLPDARFDCQGSGGCCRGFSFGPVPDETLENLKRLDVGRLVPDLGDEPFYERVPVDGGEVWALRSRRGACLFLDDEAHCRIHAAHGADVKPWFCRAFPFALVAGPEGLRLCIRPECAGRHEPSETPLADHVDAVLADADHYPFRAVFPDGTALPGGAPVPPPAYPRVEAALLDAIDRTDGPFDSIFPTLVRVLRAVAEALDLPIASATRAAAEQALRPLVRACATEAEALTIGRNESPPGWSAAKLRELAAAGPRATGLTEQAERFLREELRNHVFSGAVTVYGGLAAGLGSLLFSSLVARGYAAARAGEPVDVEAVSTAWALWHRVCGWRDPEDAWVPLRGHLEALFLGW